MSTTGSTYRPGEGRTALTRARREILTPEGIPISFTLASAGDRGAALALDLIIMGLIIAALLTIANAAFGATFSEGSWLMPLLIVALFLISNFYHPFFEVRWRGSTPGKRVLGIRVIDARGGQLETSAVLARNLMRYLELWMPLLFAIGGQRMWPGSPGWARLVAILWTLVFLFLPLFNRDRVRAGDLIAGTRVVMQPKTMLAPDLADTTMSGHALYIPQSVAAVAAPPKARAPMFTFTDAQLSVYGEYELQTLERVLRDTAGAERDQTLAVVADKIQTKIKYEQRIALGQEERFLREFYAAQRAHLEKRMLFGKRKADKYGK